MLEVDAALERLAAASGAGSVGARRAELDDLAGRATAPEWDFLTRVILGELRTGALEGVLLDAIARASGQDAATVRRAAMLSGDLGETARIALAGADGELAGVGLVVGRPVHADAGVHRGVGRRCGRDRRGGGIRRIQAGRRTHPGASGGR